MPVLNVRTARHTTTYMSPVSAPISSTRQG